MHNIDWDSLDWSRSNRELAEALGVSRETVRLRRLLHRPETAPHRCVWRGRRVNWAWSNLKIARRLGVSLTAVRLARWRLTKQQ